MPAVSTRQAVEAGRALPDGALPALPRLALEIALYIALYVALDWISLIEPFGALGIAPWNPSAGLSFTLLLLRGPRFIPVAFAAVLLSDILFRDLAQAPPAMLASAAVIAGGYGLAAQELRRRLAPSLGRSRDLWHLLGTALVATGAVAGAVTAIFAGGGLVTADDAVETALHFWVGDLIGIAVLTPLLLSLLDRGRLLPPPGARALAEYGLQLLAIALGLWIIFGLESANHFEFSYVLFLPLIWIALRDGLQGAVWGVVATQAGLMLAVQFKGFDAAIVTQFQLLMLAVAVTGLSLGAVVDERQRAEIWLKEHEAELAQAARLTATGEMAGALAHELNQPLTALIGFARAGQTVLETPDGLRDGGAEARELIDHAVHQALRVGDIIRSTREFLRHGDTQPVRDHLPRLFEAVIDLVRARAQRHEVQLVSAVADGLPPIFADPIQIEQVLLNLLRNSMDALVAADSPLRRITVAATLAADDPGFVEVSVRDSGPGFSAEANERLFTPFATTRESGMGLGLSISRSLVEAHGGRIWVQPSAVGADVRFTLPLYNDERAET